MSEYGNVIFIYHKTSLYSLPVQLKATEKHGSGICANYSRWFLSIHTVFKGLYIANVSKSLASTYIPPHSNYLLGGRHPPTVGDFP